jgi:hypothetical protein
MSMPAGAGGVQLLQRYELAAALCEGLRVLDLGDAPATARRALESSAAEVVVAGDGEPPADSFDAVLALDGLSGGERRSHMLAELERRAAEGTRVIAALERAHGQPASPRVDPGVEDAAAAFAGRLPDAVVLRQFLAEGALIEPPDGDGTAPRLDLRGGDTRQEDAAALIVASGFEHEALSQARASLRLAAAPVLHSYVRGLETAHTELLRANRELMRERVGRAGSAAASLVNAQRELDTMRAIARNHEEQVRRVEAWYDAPRYHLADRVRDAMTRMPGLPGLIRLLWSLISTRAESPRLDAAANREPDEAPGDATQITREREGMPAAAAEKPETAETSGRLEE